MLYKYSHVYSGYPLNDCFYIHKNIFLKSRAGVKFQSWIAILSSSLGMQFLVHLFAIGIVVSKRPDPLE